MKAATAYKTISEVSETLRLPAHVLRFWETKFPQIAPLKRSGGRRFYKPQDIDVIARIRELLHVQGYTIRGVQQLLRSEKLSRSAMASVQNLQFELASVAPIVASAPPPMPLKQATVLLKNQSGEDSYLQTMIRVRSTLQAIRDELDELQKQVSNRV